MISRQPSVILLIAAVFSLCFFAAVSPAPAQDQVNILLNYPETGPYQQEGKDQWRAAEMARIEINSAGGILGKKVKLVMTDSVSNAPVSVTNVNTAIDRYGVKMVFGGSSSGVAVAVSQVCKERQVPFFGTLTYSTSTTGEKGNRYTFRECYDSYAAAKAIASYLKRTYEGQRFFYITADYTWGWTTEASMRKFTNTNDKKAHPGVLTRFPSYDFTKALRAAERANPKVLVLVLFGQEMATAIRQATSMGLKKKMQIIVPNLTIGMAERGTPEPMSGVIGALPWSWKVPYEYNYPRGQEFVERFSQRFNRYPSTSAASAYAILYEYKAAVERAGSFDSTAVIKALEGHKYQLLKDQQEWRRFDHQSIQTVYVVRCNPASVVLKDKYHLDYFDFIDSMSGDDAFITRSEWNAVRRENNVPINLEKLPGE
jgi:ABC-type branched-subunit amino acid transport system substrate-binding protein